MITTHFRTHYPEGGMTRIKLHLVCHWPSSGWVDFFGWLVVRSMGFAKQRAVIRRLSVTWPHCWKYTMGRDNIIINKVNEQQSNRSPEEQHRFQPASMQHFSTGTEISRIQSYPKKLNFQGTSFFASRVWGCMKLDILCSFTYSYSEEGINHGKRWHISLLLVVSGEHDNIALQLYL